MGLNATGGQEWAPVVSQGTFTSSTTSTATLFLGTFNLSLWGTFSATMVLQRSFDAGTTWLPVSVDNSGTANTFTAPVSLSLNEIEPGVFYQLSCTFTSGTVNYRLSGGPRNT